MIKDLTDVEIHRSELFQYTERLFEDSNTYGNFFLVLRERTG